MSKIHVWCGLDVSKPFFDAGLVYDQPLSDFSKVPSTRFPRNEMGVESFGLWIADLLGDNHIEPRQIGFVMEATGVYSLELFELLKDQGWEHISLINPRFGKDFIKSLGIRNKTDRIDAIALGFFGRERTPKTYKPQEPEYQYLRDLVRYRRTLVEQLKTLKSRLSTMKNAFIVKELRRQVKNVERAVKRCKDEIKKHINAYETLSGDLKLMCSMPGVGEVTAWTILGELGNLRFFQRSRELSSLAGTAPTVYESGISIRRKTRISKDCGKAVRRVLYMACLAAIRKTDTPFSIAYHRMVRNGKAKKAAILAIMRKMLVIQRSMLISGTYFDPGLPGCGKPVDKFGRVSQKLLISA